MKELFARMADALRNGEDLVLCSIIASSGSSPRGAGAKMALFADGSTYGTVGGGAVEYESIKLAKKAMAEKSAFTAGFNLSKNQTADIGMICGGQVTVYFQFFSGGDASAIRLFDRIVSLFGMQKNSWLVTRIGNGSKGNKTFYALWQVNTYSIKFSANGGSGTMTDQTGLKYGTSYTLKANAYKRTGYTFNGWNTKADGSGTSYANKASVKNLSAKDGATVTLYARWKKK